MSTPADDDTLNELAAVADELIEQAAALRRRWSELGDALGVDLDAPVAANGHPPDATPAAPAGRAVEEETFDDTSVALRAQYDTDEVPDPVRVLAFDMMLSGRSRKEVKEFVRTTYGQDTDVSVVDELFDTR